MCFGMFLWVYRLYTQQAHTTPILDDLEKMADEAKAKGNAAFAAANYSEAIRHYTTAIELSPDNHIFYSNRSAAYASLSQYSQAVSDAQETVQLKPDWSKGYSRLGAAHLGLRHYDDAVLAYKKGLEIDPNNEALKSGLADAESSAVRSRAPQSSPFGDIFSGADMWTKLTADPSTRLFLQQPDFVRIMQDIQRNPSNLNLYLKDQRVMQALGVLLNVKIGTPNSADDLEMGDAAAAPAAAQFERKRPAEEEEEEEEEEMEVGEKETEKKERKEKEKEAGNAAYKKKDFERGKV